jgi:excisionase family DNA binding protein
MSTETPTVPRIAYTIREACKTGLFAKSRCYELIADGVLPAKMSGGKMVIMAADLEAYAHSLPDAPVKRRAA